MEIPVYLLTGFFERGKTTFLHSVLADGFADESTLLISCEEGMVDYDPALMKNVNIVRVEDEDQLTTEYLKKLEKQYRPQQVVVEYNGMWLMDHFCREVLPSNWILYQIICTINGPDFDLYSKNMGQLMMEKVMNADMIIFNRCTDQVAQQLRKRNIKMANRRAEIYIDYADGRSEEYANDSVSPFDLSRKFLDLTDGDFGFWYVDVMDHPDRYEGIKVHFIAQVCKLPDLPDNMFVPGRFAMVCCAEDITFLGVPCEYDKCDLIDNRDWVEVTAEVHAKPFKMYDNGVGPVLTAIQVKPTSAPARDYITF